MSLPVIVNPSAEADLIAGYAWCERRRAGQGADFLLCVDEVFARIGRQPELYAQEFEELRVAPLRRHQYAVAYRIDAAQITVVAVYHLGSDPAGGNHGREIGEQIFLAAEVETDEMAPARKLNLLPVADYLAGELISPIKHEYLGGIVYAMAGAGNAHKIIATNIVGALYALLRGRPCRPFNSDAKIRVRLATQVRFYYPDASVVCRPNPQTDSFQDDPAVLFEVLSRGTRRTDEGEKKDAYLTIPSLAAYVMLEQDTAAAVVFRRTEAGFVREIYEGLDALLPLAEIGIDLPLAEIYEAVEFTPEPPEDKAS